MAEFSDSGNEDNELWIAPKLTRPATSPGESSRLTPTAGRAPARAATVATAKAADRPLNVATKRAAEKKQQHGSQRHSQRRPHSRRNGDLSELKLSGVQILSWYVPRLLFLFLIGWTCSVGVQFIHAQQKSDGDSPAAAAAPRGENSYWGQKSQGTEGKASDSDDGDGDYFYSYENVILGWRTGTSSGSSRESDEQELTRDLISRVLQHASWSDGISGLMTVLVGTAYPFLDWKWRSYPSHRVGWNEVLRCVGGFLGVNYAALKLPFETASQSLAIMVIISLGLWVVCDGTLHGLLLSTSTSLMATWLLYVHALTNYASFTQDDYLGMLSYLPSVLFTYCVMTGSIGRRLGFHPLWRKYRSRHLHSQPA
ncbi:hypothetical protein GQ54DRAFT_256707 [Martensiomyces pterosporus]|nr:hypothetical protein GQ54DRAFT_256707 [Martensiomyces pterosporus]